MDTAKQPAAVYDPVVKRYKATCPSCGWIATRAKRESAEHNLAQHLNYGLCAPRPEKG
jgi:hypothetical protein